MFSLVRYQVGPAYLGRDLDPFPPVNAFIDLVGRRLNEHQDHVHLVRVAARDYLISRIVGEGQAGVRLDDVGAYGIGIPRVDVVTVVFNLELDGDLAGVGDSLASDQR